ncbi:hypothetical protein [Nonomuraea sp. NEAU-A123]|uniref:hypothetical protein n=1 Tax=Nonomuraea sp. NEAU-A123 TaxID=2839649 RepID=UPI001BE4AB12|nr:hypothetical protein [Nonomuraea sp. NEAU-A123]MBT2225768.1 hypothetical protein [Nonomuraea sp. NEAU-A123]
MRMITGLRVLVAGAAAAAALLAPITIASAQADSAPAAGNHCGMHPLGGLWLDGDYGYYNGAIYVCRDGVLVKL